MSELPEYKEISEKYMDEEKKLSETIILRHVHAVWDVPI